MIGLPNLTKTLPAAALLLSVAACEAFAPGFGEFGGEQLRDPRDRAAQRDTMLQLRLETLLPALMEESGVDCWMVLSNGPAGDPLIGVLTVSATRPEGKSALLICAAGDGVRRLAIGRGFAANSTLYEIVEPTPDEPLEFHLNAALAAASPQRIAIDDAPSFAPADGLSASNRRWLEERVAPEMVTRMVSSRLLVERFLATQLDVEAALFTESSRLTVDILEYVLSDRVVVSAGTSLLDIEWAVRTQAARISVDLAFAPQVVVYRPDATLEAERSMDLDLRVQPGDLVFLATGVRYLGYANRVGRWAYLLRTGERTAPAWVDDALGGLADSAAELSGRIAMATDAEAARDLTFDGPEGFANRHIAIDRVGRLVEGAHDPFQARTIASAWHPEYRLAADTGLVISLAATIQPPGPGAPPLPLLLLETALATADGVTFVVAPQRTPLLID